LLAVVLSHHRACRTCLVGSTHPPATSVLDLVYAWICQGHLPPDLDHFSLSCFLSAIVLLATSIFGTAQHYRSDKNPSKLSCFSACKNSTVVPHAQGSIEVLHGVSMYLSEGCAELFPIPCSWHRTQVSQHPARFSSASQSTIKPPNHFWNTRALSAASLEPARRPIVNSSRMRHCSSNKAHRTHMPVTVSSTVSRRTVAGYDTRTSYPRPMTRLLRSNLRTDKASAVRCHLATTFCEENKARTTGHCQTPSFGRSALSL
jgi:hypothetical protein